MSQHDITNPDPEDPAMIATEIEEIMHEYETPLLRYATRLLNDPSAAQDVVQDTFIKLHQVCTRGQRPDRQLSSWLYRVTHNKAVDYIRKESRLRNLHEKEAAEHPGTHEADRQELDRNEAMQLTLKLLRTLDQRDQQVVILRLQEGRTYREIAEITGLTEGHVGYLLHHAVKKLSEKLHALGAL